MTREVFYKYQYAGKHERPMTGLEPAHNDLYIGKHEPLMYQVWRVLGPAGPTETFWVSGKKALREALLGTWDAEIRNEKGAVILEQTIFPHGLC